MPTTHSGECSHNHPGKEGISFRDLAPGGEACGLFHSLRHAHQAPGTVRHEYRVEGISHGAQLWDTMITPLPSLLNGKAVVLLQIIDNTDASHLREDRDRLHSLAEQRAEQFAIATESIDNGIIVVDNNGRVRRINSVGITLLDLSEQEADAIPSATSAERRQIDLPPLHLALRGQSVRDFEHCITRRDGERTWINVSSFPLYDRHGGIYGAVAAFQDITDRRQLDQIKEDFLSVTAHELRTPVTALLGYTNLLVRRAEHGDWNDRDLHALRMIETQVQRLTQLINGLVDVSRVHAGALEIHAQPVELQALVQQAAGLIRGKAPDHLIVVEGHTEPVVVAGDPQRLDQVISHLIENALKFSPWGGTITVRVWADDEAHVSRFGRWHRHSRRSPITIIPAILPCSECRSGPYQRSRYWPVSGQRARDRPQWQNRRAKFPRQRRDLRDYSAAALAPGSQPSTSTAAPYTLPTSRWYRRA